MSFGLNKCATTSAMKGNFVERSDVALADDFTIQALDVLDFYEYLGMFENEAIIVSIVTSIYKKRVKKALKLALNGRNVIMAINTWALLSIQYIVGVVKWTQAEIRALDVSTRKLLALYKCFSINDDIQTLHVP